MSTSRPVWFDNSGNHYTQDELNEIFRDRSLNKDQKIFVGTDSHRGRKSKHVAVTTAICAWNDEFSKGGWYCFNRVHVPKQKFASLYERLYHEVQTSIDTACMICDEWGLNVAEVHIDVNPKESEASSKYATMLKGLVEAYGFTCVMKPDSFAASGVADKHAR